MTTTTTACLDAALTYAARGWRVHPIAPQTKHPSVKAWQDAATTDPELIRQWWAAWPDHGVGIATGEASGVFVLDVDCAEGKVGFESLSALEAQHGPLPPTVEAITGTGGRHLFYRHPPGLELNNSAGRLGTDLDIRANGGQVLAAPTAHPVTGVPYAWDLERHPADVPVADAPPWLLELLRPPARSGNGTSPSTAERGNYEAAILARDRYNLHPGAADEVARLLTQAGWREGRPDRDGARYFTRPGKREGISATLGKVAPGVLYVFTSSAPPLTAERPYDPVDVLTDLVYAGDRREADRALVEAGWGVSAYGIDLTVLPAEHELVESRWLPDHFWKARPVLAQIRQAAHARLVAPDAVFASILARVAAITPHTVELPPLVGKAMGLTFYALVVGAPSTGKSTAAGVAAELLPVPPGRRSEVLDLLPVGSGEGFVDILFEMRPDPDDEKGKRLVRTQTRHAAIFDIDEGAILAELGARSGTTIMSTLRTAFSHGTLGAVNASLEKRRVLHGQSYVYGVTMGLQPDKAEALLSDAAAGTPQRFVWLMATDPGITDDLVEWPGIIDWSPPMQALGLAKTISGSGALDGFVTLGYNRHRLSVPPEVAQEVRAERLAAMREQATVEEGDAHRTLVRLKVAALLGLLDGRAGIDLTDWELARLVVDCSRRVRLSIEAGIARERQAAAEQKVRQHVAVTEAVEGSKEARALRSGSRSVAAVVLRHTEGARHAEGSCLRSCLSHAVASGHRNAVGLDAILTAAVEAGWVAPVGDRWILGPSRPA